MKLHNLILVVLAATLATACASRQAKTEGSASDSAPAAKTSAKDSGKKEAAADGEIVGKPAPGSKFSKLKIGMTLAQATSLIGPPTNQWHHPTGKASIPFYFGPDRWVYQYSYKGEGVLTFNTGGDQALTRIEVNKAEQ